jgi:7-cyano-7-deazaguanine synthase
METKQRSDEPTAIVLLSGGLDSAVAAYLARKESRLTLALTVDYGQKAARHELAAAYRISRDLGVPHRTVFLPFLREAARGALVDPGQDVPRPEAADLDDVAGRARETARAVWVPNRNGAFIAMAATYAESQGAAEVVVGFNREEGATFADNTPEFLEATNAALACSTSNHVRVVSPTLRFDKVDIVRAAMRDNVPIELCWSCYLGENEPCGTCESCRRFERAVRAAGATEWLAERRRRETP